MASGFRSITGGSDEMFVHECDVCKYNNKTSEAISFCTVCPEYLCKACEDSHRGSRATRDHKIVTGNSMPSSPASPNSISPAIYCEHHKTMTLNVYCENHDDVICGTCKLADHQKCKTIDVKQRRIKIGMKEYFDDIIKQMVSLKKIYENFKFSREQHKENVKLQKSACLDDLQKMVRTIKDTIDKLEKNLIMEASDIEERMVKEIDDHVTIADDALNQISGQMKFLEANKKSKADDVIFVCMKKARNFKTKYEDVYNRMQAENRPVRIQFKPNDAITDILIQLQSLGTIECINNSSSVFNMTVGERRETDVGCHGVFDCTFIGDSHLVLACGSDGLKLLDKHFKVQSQLPDYSFRVATINENDVIVTQDNMKQLQRVSIFPNMAVTKTLKMDRYCWGVDVFNNEIYVTCHDGPGNGEVRVLNMDGILQRQLGVNDGQYMFSRPDYIKASRDGSKVFISDLDTSKVTCLSQQGDVLYQYTDRELEGPEGMYVDDEGSVLVCGGDSHNVHMINRDGSKQKIMLSQKDGMKYPVCISYRPRDGCLMVGMLDAGKSLIVYQTRIA